MWNQIFWIMRNTPFKHPHLICLSEMASQSLRNVEFCDTCHVKNVYNMIMCFINMHRQTCAHALMQSLYACGACFACECYGLVTGTCLHSSKARGRLSKNSSNPTGVCVLSSIPSPLWPRLEGLEVEGFWAQAVSCSRNSFTGIYTHIS